MKGAATGQVVTGGVKSAAPTVTTTSQLDSAPFAFVILTVIVYDPAVAASTVTVCAVLEPLIVPLPVIDHK